MPPNEHNEVMYMLGEMRGDIKGILSYMEKQNGRIGKSEDRIGKLESAESYRKGQNIFISTVVSAVVSIAGLFIPKQ